MTTPATIEMQARPAGLGVARLAVLAELAPAVAGAAPSWKLNSGAEMVTRIDGLNQGAPIILVIDLLSAKFAAPEIEMMREHWVGPIGRWANLSSTLEGPKGPGIYGSPIFYTSETDAEREMTLLREADEVAALLKRKHPWQASVEIGGAVEQYKLIPPGESISVNGQTYEAPVGPNAMPLMVLYDGVVAEASVCLRGADADTGPTLLAARAAAAKAAAATPTTTSKESTMDLKALLAKYDPKHHGAVARLHADGKSADEIATAILAEDKKAMSDEISTLKANLDAATKAAADAKAAADSKIAELQAQIDALKPPADDATGKDVPAAGSDAGAAGAQLAAPKTVTEGMARLSASGDKRTGFKLRNAVLAKWPALRKAIPAAV